MAPVNNLPPQTPGALPQFDSMRRRAKQQANAQGLEAQDALKRRFAASGMLNSGAAIKQAQLAQQENARIGQEAQSQIDFAEQERLRAMEDQRNQMVFQAGEAEKQRGFQQGMFDREFDFKKDTFNRQFDFQKDQFNYQKMAAEREFKVNMMNQKIGLALNLKNMGISEHDFGVHMSRLNDLGIAFDVDANGNVVVGTNPPAQQPRYQAPNDFYSNLIQANRR